MPVAVLGEELQGLPVGDAVEADEGLGDGVLFDVEGQSGDPLDEAASAGVRETRGDVEQQGLPEGPQSLSLHVAPPARWSADWSVLTRSARAVPSSIIRGQRQVTLPSPQV